MELNATFKKRVRDEVIARRNNYGGSDAKFAKTIGLNPSSFSKLKADETDRVISDNEWLRIGKEFNVRMVSDNWKVARTSIYNEIESNLIFCKDLSKSMILVDDCGIGKTFCTRHILKSMKNAFYLDCSQYKTCQQFVRGLAKTIGVDDKGKYVDVKSDLKYYLGLLDKPLIVLDETGDLSYPAFLEVKELWNGTDGICGWYMMGADGLRAKIRKGINNKRVGFAELFSRFSDEFIQLIPQPKEDKQAYYRKLLSDVAKANCNDKTIINQLVAKCLKKETTLRYLETLIKVNQ